jgi:hypothetical protein
MRPTIYVLHSALAPSSVPEVLRLSIDEERRTLFSMSGYQGDRPVLGKVDGNTLTLQKRGIAGTTSLDGFMHDLSQKWEERE